MTSGALTSLLCITYSSPYITEFDVSLNVQVSRISKQIFSFVDGLTTGEILFLKLLWPHNPRLLMTATNTELPSCPVNLSMAHFCYLFSRASKALNRFYRVAIN